jgi:hypothetical protein
VGQFERGGVSGVIVVIQRKSFVRLPSAQEQYIPILDNKGRTRIQHVEFIVDDVRQEAIYVTADGLQSVRDSLQAKVQDYLLAELDKLPNVLENPDIVIWDPVDSPGETLLYYKRLYIAELRSHKLVSAIVKVRQGIKFFYNFFLQESGKVKGLSVVSPAEIKIWYIAPKLKPSQFGL